MPKRTFLDKKHDADAHALTYASMVLDNWHEQTPNAKLIAANSIKRIGGYNPAATLELQHRLEKRLAESFEGVAVEE